MDKRHFQAYGLDPHILKRASALYPRIESLTAPNRGFTVPPTALAPICALIACEEMGSTKVTEQMAQAMACLKHQDWTKALRNARVAMELAAERQNTPRKDSRQSRLNMSLLKASSSLSSRKHHTPGGEVVVVDRGKKLVPAASRFPAQQSVIRASTSTSVLLPYPAKNVTAGRTTRLAKKLGGSKKKPTLHTFLTLSRRYKLDYEELSDSFESIFEHLHNQGWNEDKWSENIIAIRLAVFYWVCREKHKGLRDLKIIAEETAVSHKVTNNILKSMETIRWQLLELLAEARPPQAGSEQESPKSERRTGKEKEERVSPSDDEFDDEADLQRQTKRQRRDTDTSPSRSARPLSSTPQSAGRSSIEEDQMDVDERDQDDEPARQAEIDVPPSTPSKRPHRSHISATADPSAPFESTNSTTCFTHPSSTKGKSKEANNGDDTPRKAVPARRGTDSSSQKRPLQDNATFRSVRTTATSRYRPVFPDRALYGEDAANDEDGMDTEAEDKALEAWMARTHAMLAITV
ncbi:hypothetical protein FRB96_005793 [Tulasnella sp. 330]|nr:hypothetical protein FRB96_005793 [Tulasnella sp. 330]KAG8879240.1 hypothetical protein FRB97_001824 [Tulasnella sp. 331]KAG8881737.1 hypothetical protein FRB98_004131 [Tulasnella sp. 332]